MGKRPRSNGNGNGGSYTSRLVQVARAYYLENQIQSEIARSLGISRSLVSRYLTAAREQGIVRIEIVDPEEDFREVVDDLQRAFPHLKQVVVAPSFSNDADAVRVTIGRFAALYLQEIMLPGQRLALGCGRTLRAMVDALQRRQVPDSVIVQAMGNIGHEAVDIDYNEIAREAADAFSGRAYYVSAPAILAPQVGSADVLVNTNQSLKYALSLARQADIYVVGLGSIESEQLYVRNGLIQPAEMNDLAPRAVGDICGRFYDADGQEQRAAFSDRIVGIQLDDLHQADYAVGVAGGPEKVGPILGALRGQYINVLVTDVRTIDAILAVL